MATSTSRLIGYSVFQSIDSTISQGHLSHSISSPIKQPISFGQLPVNNYLSRNESVQKTS